MSKLNILYSVRVCAYFQANPSVSHLNAMKHIIKYMISETCKYGIWYSFSSNTSIVGFSYVNWTGNMENKKSMSRGYFYLGSNMVAWYYKKQNTYHCQQLILNKLKQVCIAHNCFG